AAGAVALACGPARDQVYAPVLRLAFAALGGPLAVHLASLAAYAFAVAGSYTALRKLGVERPVAALGVGLAAVHPSRVEPVAWITGLKDTGSFALWVAAANAVCAPAASPARVALGTALGWAALLTKAATFPVPLVLAAALAVAHGPREIARRLGGLGLGAVVLAAVGAAVWAPPVDHPPLRHGPLTHAAWVHGAFTEAWLVPWPRVAIRAIPADPWPTIAVGVATTAVGAAAAWRWPRWAGPTLVSWLAPQLPFLGAAPMAFWAADRHLLSASLGPALALGWAAVRLGAAGRAAAVVLGLALAVGSAARVGDWRDSRTLWEAEVTRSGEHFARWYKVAMARAVDGAFAGAVDGFDHSLALNPGYPPAVARRALAALALDGWTDADAAAVRWLEPPPVDGAGWARAAEALRGLGRPDLALQVERGVPSP
ncbi:MAG: hypothetical protein ABMA64_30100, partial [Myxococcota bacterium]